MKQRRKILLSLTFTLALFLGVLQVYPKDSVSYAKDSFEKNELVRLDGKNRYAVAAGVLDDFYSNPDKIILASGLDFPDSISGSMLSFGKYPILYTSYNKLDPDTENSLKKARPEEVVIVGGEKVISKDIENYISKNLGIRVRRLAGANRYGTNISIANNAYSSSKFSGTIIIASGQDFADAISSSPLASKYKAPILLTEKNKLTKNTENFIKNLGKENIKNVYIVGGPVAIDKKVEDRLNTITGENAQRIAGKNRYDTSLKIAEKSYQNPKSAILASGGVYVDALTAAPLSQKIQAPILLTETNSVENKIVDYIAKDSIAKLYIMGGPKAISTRVENIFYKSSGKDVDDKKSSYEKKYPGKKIEIAPVLKGAEKYPEYAIDMGNNTVRIVRGYFDDELSKEIFDELNNYRNSKGIDKLKFDEIINSTAKNRAVEITQLFDHQRPKGGSATDIDNINGENIYKGSDNAKGIIEAWENSRGHNENMLREVFSRVNIKVFVTRVPYENSKNGETYDQYYAVQLFGI